MLKHPIIRQLSTTPVASDIQDILTVFIYNNFSALTVPDPVIALPPDIQTAVVAAINYSGANLGFASDINDVVNVVVLSELTTNGVP